jgi:uncharacterized protein YaaR (DUF327 family)
MAKKTMISITIDSDVYQKHRSAGNNISQLCNNYLISCFRETVADAVTEAAEKQIKLKELAGATDDREQVNSLLREVRDCLRLKTDGGLNTRATIIANEKRAADLLARAQEISGLSLAELRAKIANDK